MPAKTAEGKLPSPWKEFLAELDGMLSEPLRRNEPERIPQCSGVRVSRAPRLISTIFPLFRQISVSTRSRDKAQLLIKDTESGFIGWPSQIFPKSMERDCEKWRQGNSNISNCRTGPVRMHFVKAGKRQRKGPG
jgi:hypothetical protein